MNFLRRHWFDLGLALAAVVGAGILVSHPTGLALLLWLSLITLFLHQFEEYRYPGYFPGMINSFLFPSFPGSSNITPPPRSIGSQALSLGLP